MTHRTSRARAALSALCVAGLALGAGSCRTPEAPRRPEGPQAELARLERANQLLQRQVELAQGKDFYLVLDPAASTLTLMLNGAELQRFHVVRLLVGQPRVAWRARPDPRPWQDVVWSHGELDPPRQIDRLVIEAAPPSKDNAEPETPPIPKTPEEMYPVPPRYHVRFDQGRSIEVRPLDIDRQAGRWARLRVWWTAKWHDVAAALRHRDSDGVRIRLALEPKEAASLYRSLPPAVRLIILPQDRPEAPGPPSPKT